MTEFAHLHTHTEYSLLDSLSSPDDLFKKASELSIPAIGITEHGNMHSVVECTKVAAKYGVKYIVGLEAYFSDSRLSRSSSTKIHHLTLLAANSTGYRNLCKLSKLSWTEGFYRKPRIDYDALEAYNDGIICLSGCLSGPVSVALRNGKDPLPALKRFKSIFGDRYFMEIWDHHIAIQSEITPKLVALGREYNIPIVASGDCHYVNKEDYYTHSVLRSIGMYGKTPAESAYPTQEFHLKTSSEMKTLWTPYPEAVTNTIVVADLCDFKLDLTTKHAPRYNYDGDKDLLFKELCASGLRKRYASINSVVIDRLRMEIGVISDLGYIDYFLILWDLRKFCMDNDIPSGPGRGSASGSIVSYCLGITDVDPIEYGLLFERFLNKDRVSDPDIDMDFCKTRRGEVISYLIAKYGEENVSRIVTFSRLHGRSVARDVGKSLDFPASTINMITALIPKVDSSYSCSLLRGNKAPVLRSIPDTESFINTCIALEGVIRHKGCHAAGILIGDKPLDEIVPLCNDKEGLLCQYSMEDAEAVGLLKIDILGLDTLTIVHRCLKTLGKEMSYIQRPEVYTDPDTYKLLSEGRTVGVFQVESSGMREVLTRLKPTCISDLATVVALFRPGPIDSGMCEEYLLRKEGKAYTSLHPAMDEILSETLGVLVTQEQILKLVRHLCGWDFSTADSLRKIIGKKKLELMPEQKKSFIKSSMVHSNLSSTVAHSIWDLIETFGKYGFPAAHAVAYSMITCWTAYLKAHFPIEYMAAQLSSKMSINKELFQWYVFECTQRLGIKVLPPEINKSSYLCTVEVIDGKKYIRCGIGQIDGISIKSYDKIWSDGTNIFKDLGDFCKHAKGLVNKAVIIPLIHSGAFDSLISTRFGAVSSIDDIMKTIVNDCLFDNLDLSLDTDIEYSEDEKKSLQTTALSLYVV